MYTEYPSGVGRTFTLEYKDSTGAPFAPVTASYVLLDEDEVESIVDTVLVVSGSPTSVDISTLGADNTVTTGQIRSFRTLRMTFVDAAGDKHVVENKYVLAVPSALLVAANSFGDFGRLWIALAEMPELEEALSASESDLKNAFIGAWHNIGNLTVKFGDVRTTYDLTSMLISDLDSKAYSALLRAQCIEANAVLGGNPVEDRRQMGFISNSSGESTQFFRSSKPLDLPVSKQTMNALRGYVSWELKIGR